jgi:cytochrome c-type biogenesis protein CcmH
VSATTTATARRVSWLLMALVLAAALLAGATGNRSPRTEAERVRAIASTVRCPTCRGLSAAESDARAAQAVREDIRDRLRAGQSAGEIRAFLVSRYGEDILLKPRASGVAALVWVLPVAALVLAAAGLVAAFRRWRGQRAVGPPTDDDRAIVEAALSL